MYAAFQELQESIVAGISIANFFLVFGQGGTKLGPTYQVGYYRMHKST